MITKQRSDKKKLAMHGELSETSAERERERDRERARERKTNKSK